MSERPDRPLAPIEYKDRVLPSAPNVFPNKLTETQTPFLNPNYFYLLNHNNYAASKLVCTVRNSHKEEVTARYLRLNAFYTAEYNHFIMQDRPIRPIPFHSIYLYSQLTLDDLDHWVDPNTGVWTVSLPFGALRSLLPRPDNNWFRPYFIDPKNLYYIYKKYMPLFTEYMPSNEYFEPWEPYLFVPDPLYYAMKLDGRVIGYKRVQRMIRPAIIELFRQLRAGAAAAAAAAANSNYLLLLPLELMDEIAKFCASAVWQLPLGTPLPPVANIEAVHELQNPF